MYAEVVNDQGQKGVISTESITRIYKEHVKKMSGKRSASKYGTEGVDSRGGGSLVSKVTGERTDLKGETKNERGKTEPEARVPKVLKRNALKSFGKINKGEGGALAGGAGVFVPKGLTPKAVIDS